MLDIRDDEVIYGNADSVLDNWNYILGEIIAEKPYENMEVIYPYKDKKKKFSFNAYPIKNKSEENYKGNSCNI